MTIAKPVLKVLKDAGIGSSAWNDIVTICQFMPTDPDGCWSMLQDHGYEIEFEDISAICEYFVNR